MDPAGTFQSIRPKQQHSVPLSSPAFASDDDGMLSLCASQGSSDNAAARFEEVLAASEAQLLADDTPSVLQALRAARETGGRRIDIIVDNAGFELVRGSARRQSPSGPV